MSGGYAQGKAELKVFFSCEKMQWQILVPEAWWDWHASEGGRCSEDRSQDHPVVCKSYSAVHASAMPLQYLQLTGSRMTLLEDTEQVCQNTWKGLWLSDLMMMRNDLMQFSLFA